MDVFHKVLVCSHLYLKVIFTLTGWKHEAKVSVTHRYLASIELTSASCVT